MSLSILSYQLTYQTRMESRKGSLNDFENDDVYGCRCGRCGCDGGIMMIKTDYRN